MLDFTIPTSKDDLLCEHADRYVPRNIVAPDVVVRKYSECSNALRQNGFKFILDHFDTMASYLIHFQKLSWDDSIKGWYVLHHSLQSMVTELRSLLKSNDSLESEVRQPAANAIKMLVYLTTQSVIAYEERVKKIGESRIKKKGANNAFAELSEWQCELAVAVGLLHELVLLPLVWLWDPPVPSSEEAFFHLLGNMAFSILENPAIVTIKLADVKEGVLHMLGIMVKRYNYKISIVLRLSDALTQTEHTASVVAQAVALLQKQYNCQSAVRELVREVTEMHSEGAEVSPLAARNHGQFLGEVSELAPDVFKEILPSVLPLLDSPHVSMRNGMLSAVCAVIIKCLSRNDLTVADQRQRDELLDVLLDYIYDTNAFVRSKVVSLWRRIVEEGAVPLQMRSEVLEAVGGRILDVASSVRKGAIQLVMLFLQNNPALAERAKEAGKLSEEKAKLLEMQDRFREGNPRDMKWLEMQPFVTLQLQEYFEEKESEDGNENLEEPCDESSGEESVQSGAEKEVETDLFVQQVHKDLCHALDKKQVVNALKCINRIKHLASTWFAVPGEGNVLEKVDFYVRILGFFYKFESLTKDVLVQTMGQAIVEREELEKIKAQELYVEYLEWSQAFMQQVQNALMRLEAYLRWAAAAGGDVAVPDAVCLARAAHGVGVPGAVACMRTVLQLLLYEPEQAVVEAVADGVKAVYFLSPISQGLSIHERPVVSLLALLSELTASEAKALETLVHQWLKAGDLSHRCVGTLWAICERPEHAIAASATSAATPLCPRRRRLLALALLKMAAPALPERVRALAPEVARVVFAGEECDLEAAAAACSMLAATCPAVSHSHSASVGVARLPATHVAFATLSSLLARAFAQDQDPHFVTLGTQAIDFAYALCLSPEPFVEGILRNLLTIMNEQKKQNVESGKFSTQSSVASQQHCVSSLSLGRFLALVGHIAMMQMIFMDTAVYSKIKSLDEKDKADVKKQRKPRKKRDANKKQSNVSIALEDPPSPGSNMSSLSSSALETEEGTQAEDRVSEHIREVCEQEMFRPDRLLGQLLPLVHDVVSKPRLFECVALQRSAMLALAKMMMVSSSVCQDYIQLYVTVMEKSPDPETRAQAIICIADITLRFPNIVEPWSKHVYARLQDGSEVVRLTTIFILSRLVMCDMIKVRGQISDLALCICDNNPCIADASRAFFRELSQKHNVLYNVLPDIISGLCASDLPESKFNEITSFVFGLMKKEKQVEVLVEKLCQRFHVAASDRQASDLAFCLTLLHYSPKALARLTDHIALYADKLHIEKVFHHFQSIINTYTKCGVKPELKTSAEELMNAVEQALKVDQSGKDEDVVLNLRQKLPRKTPRNTRSVVKVKNETPKSTRSTRRKTQSARKVLWSSEEEDEDRGQDQLADIRE